MSFTLKHIEGPISKEINLPASKSISNRLLIIHALCKKRFTIENLSAANDTKILKKALRLKNKIIDAGEGGTTLRFLFAFLSGKDGVWKLSGSKRLMQRPIEPLIDALKKLGGDIEWRKNHWLIKGKSMTGGKLRINSGSSSQFISALLLVAPTFKNGLQLLLKGKVVSSSYIDMTIELMRDYGIGVTVNKKTISVAHGKYQSKNSSVEADWSAASCFYELAALNPGSKILLKRLKDDSLQGDRVVAELFEVFGVKSSFFENGVLIVSEEFATKTLKHKENELKNLVPSRFSGIKISGTLIFDIKDCPDLFPALVVTCAAKKINATFKNTSHLNSKESERANVFAQLLQQLGCKVKQTKNTFSIEAKNFQLPTSSFQLFSHNDHRIAMCFAPLASLFSSITFDDEKVVRKSFPDFWMELKKKNS